MLDPQPRPLPNSVPAIVPTALVPAAPAEIVRAMFEDLKLLEATPLIRAMRMIRDREQHPELRKVFDDLVNQMQQGKTLAGALKAHPNHFDSCLVAIVHVGECVNCLDRAIALVVHLLETNERIATSTSFSYAPLEMRRWANAMGHLLLADLPLWRAWEAAQTAVSRPFAEQLRAVESIDGTLSDKLKGMNPPADELLIELVTIGEEESRLAIGQNLIQYAMRATVPTLPNMHS